MEADNMELDNEELDDKELKEGVIEIFHRLADKTFLFEHDAVSVNYNQALEDDMFVIEDVRFFEKENWEDADLFFMVLLENIDNALDSGKPVFVISYSPAIAFLLQSIAEQSIREIGTSFTQLVFFHSDEETNWLTDPEEDEDTEYETDYVEFKKDLVKEMSEFHLLKRFEVHIEFTITPRYFKRLLKEIAGN